MALLNLFGRSLTPMQLALSRADWLSQHPLIAFAWGNTSPERKTLKYPSQYMIPNTDSVRLFSGYFPFAEFKMSFKVILKKKKLKYKVRKITIHHGESRLFNSEDSSKSHQASPIQYNSSKFTSSSTWQPKKGSSNSLSCRIETPHCQKQNSTCTGRRNTPHFPPHGSNEMESWNILKSVPPHAVRSQITFLLKLYLLHRSFS